ncbi:MAG TPA: bifunctional serine/threonine protein kinase/MFS transporter [Gemmataceae bacterium]|nr:bifunctional serine/threonine protein kinase/MFS transporter [Gemmataceae bacterium]
MAEALTCAHCRAMIAASPQATLPAVCPQCGKPYFTSEAGGIGFAITPTPMPAAIPPTREDVSAQPTRPKQVAATNIHARPQIPGFDVLEELGRGGMGVVYKARQVGLNRLVAIKMILGGEHAGEQDRERFRTEAEAIARLQHPNIVQIYEIGDHHGTPFVVLEFCDDGSLSHKLRGTPLPAAEAAEIIEALASGMQHAHQHGIIHRDLKPGNILLSRLAQVSGGVVSGEWSEKDTRPTTHHSPLTFHQPKITDFGLAKKLDAAEGQTRTGAIMGTPSYMSPEQAAGRKDIGPAADIYSLGALLYECLTGRPPFRAHNELETITQVLERAPLPPHLLNPNVPHDLETICLKCLQKDPAKRYASAGELADDLQRWRNGESIHARSFNLLEMVASNLRRSQYDVQFAAWGSMLLGFAMVLLVGTAATSMVLALEWHHEVQWIWGIHVIMLVVMSVIFFFSRKEGFWPTTTAERQLWVLLGGFVGTCLILGVSDWLLATEARPHHPLAMYPRFAVVSGFLFLVLASSYWGECYIFGGLFWALAVLMSFYPKWSAVEFGLLWTAALLVIGLHLRRMSEFDKVTK